MEHNHNSFNILPISYLATDTSKANTEGNSMFKLMN